jgi:hypothetical protein
MAWKMRKDKLKAGAPDGETAPEGADAATLETETAEAPPVFDLSGSAFQPQAPPAEVQEPELPHFVDDAPVAPTFAPEPIALEPAPPLVDDLEPLPEFAAVAAPKRSKRGTAPIAKAPTAPAEEESVTEEPVAEVPEAEAAAPEFPTYIESPVVAEAAVPVEPEISPEREALAVGLVTTETETGLPRVAPFILDTPPIVAEAPAVPQMHTIVIRIGRMSANYFLTKDVTTVGRPDGVVQNYPDIEIDLDDGVSRRHAEIRFDGEGYTITDVGSTNGTLLNGAPLTPHQSVVLQAGDKIRVGERTELLFE